MILIEGELIPFYTLYSGGYFVAAVVLLGASNNLDKSSHRRGYRIFWNNVYLHGFARIKITVSKK